jgi:hypothetical protein
MTHDDRDAPVDMDALADVRVNDALNALGTIEPPDGFVGQVMWRTKHQAVAEQTPRRAVRPVEQGVVMAKKVLIGLAAMAAVGLAVAYIGGFPPADRTEGTIGAAQRYQAEQITKSDVKVGDATLQAFLQTDIFDKLAHDKRARTALANPAVQQALASPAIAQALADQSIQQALASPEFQQTLNAQGVQSALALAGLQQALAGNQMFRYAMASPAFADALATPALQQALSSPAFQLALSSQAFQQALSAQSLSAQGLSAQGASAQELAAQGLAAQGLAAQGFLQGLSLQANALAASGASSEQD